MAIFQPYLPVRIDMNAEIANPNWANQIPFENKAATACSPMLPELRALDTKVKAKFWAIRIIAHSAHSQIFIG